MRRIGFDVHRSVHLCRFDHVHGSANLSRDRDVLGFDLVYPHEDVRADLDLSWQRDMYRDDDLQGPGDL